MILSLFFTLESDQLHNWVLPWWFRGGYFYVTASGWLGTKNLFHLMDHLGSCCIGWWGIVSQNAGIFR